MTIDPFATLGLARRYDLDPSEIEQRYRDLQKALHPDKHVAASASLRRIALGKAVEVNEAYRTLRDEQKRAEALLAVLGGAAAASGEREQADPELLMEVMELREALSEAKAARDAALVRKLAGEVLAARTQVHAALAAAFAALPQPAAPSQLVPVAKLVSRLKYYQRFLDEVSTFEESL